MGTRYLRGDGYDSKAEIEALMSQLADRPDCFVALCSVLDVVHALVASGRRGFLEVSGKFDSSGIEDVFLYANAGVLAAVNVPGGGRAQTFDLTLLGTR